MKDASDEDWNCLALCLADELTGGESELNKEGNQREPPPQPSSGQNADSLPVGGSGPDLGEGEAVFRSEPRRKLRQRSPQHSQVVRDIQCSTSAFVLNESLYLPFNGGIYLSFLLYKFFYFITKTNQINVRRNFTPIF
jgi:hypothetical protein